MAPVLLGTSSGEALAIVIKGMKIKGKLNKNITFPSHYVLCI